MTDPERLKISQIVGQLTTPQLWAMLATLVGLVAAIFSAGFTVANFKAGATLIGDRPRFYW